MVQRDGQVARTVQIVAVVAGLGVLLLLAWPVFLWLFAGILLAIGLRAMAVKIGGWLKVSPGWGLLATVALFGLLLAGFGLLVAPQVASEGRELVQRLPGAWARLQGVLAPLGIANIGLPELDANTIRTVTTRTFGILSNTVGVIGSASVILVTGLYLAANPQLYRKGALLLLPVHRRARADEVLSLLHEALLGWLKGAVIGMAIIGTLTGVGLLLLGVPLSLSLGVMAGVLNFIPNLGPILSGVPAVLLVLGSGGGLEMLAWVVALYVAVQVLESYFITPTIQERTISLPPVLTIAAQLLLGLGTGLLGLALAAPLAAVAIVLVRELYVKDYLEAERG